MGNDLFQPPNRNAASKESRPLADRMRPSTLDEVVGQEELAGSQGTLRRLVETGNLPSLLFWGGPGCGKTTLAHVLGTLPGYRFISFSAVLGGVKEVRAIVQEASQVLAGQGDKTVLFVDEIHRFSKSQQDAFLPHVERGTVVLIGATTENPSFYVNAALLSRCTVARLEPLKTEDLSKLLRRAAAEERGLGGAVVVEEDAIEQIAQLADSDARRALTLLEQVAWVAQRREAPVSLQLVAEVLKKQPMAHDKAGDSHYDIVSAFIKSLRGSDPDGALYWMARLLEAGEDPLFVLRRMVIFASEDVGNADPRALQLTVSGMEAVRFLGMPEGRIALGQLATYLACAPKSNASYLAIDAALGDVKKGSNHPVPLHLRNAPTKLMKEMGAGKGYQYPHDHPGAVVEADYFPEGMPPRRYYEPKETGYEGHMKKMMEWRRSLLEERERDGDPGTEEETNRRD